MIENGTEVSISYLNCLWVLAIDRPDPSLHKIGDRWQTVARGDR